MTLPLPRLRAIRNGETFILRGETKLRTLIETDRHHGYYKDGYASLCHPLDSATLVWGRDGWRTKPRAQPEAQELHACPAES